MRTSAVIVFILLCQGLLLSSCAESKEEERLAQLQSRCSSRDANYNEDNVRGCTAFLAEPSLAPPVRAMTYNIRGNTYDKLKKHELAIADYKEVIRLQPDFAYGYANLGLQYARLGDFKSALSYYEQALKVSPQNAYAIYGRGVALSYLGETDAAKEQLASANKLDPEMEKVYVEIKMEPRLK